MTSLFLILLIAVVIAAVVSFGPRLTRRLSFRVNFFVTCGYTAALVVLTTILFFIPSTALITPLDPEKADVSSQTDMQIGLNISKGIFDAPEGYTKAKNSFVSQSESITINCDPDLMPVYVGIKGTDAPDNGSSIVDVYSYANGSVNLDKKTYALKIEPPSSMLDTDENAALSIDFKIKKPFDFYRFNDQYHFSLFGGYPSSGGGGSMTSQVVVILLPPGMSYAGKSVKPLSELINSSV